MSPSRSFLALICFAALGAAPNIAHAMVPPAGAAAGAANPGHGWIPGHHINPMLESGHASIMAKNFGAPYWRALRMRLIMARPLPRRHPRPCPHLLPPRPAHTTAAHTRRPHRRRLRT